MSLQNGFQPTFKNCHDNPPSYFKRNRFPSSPRAEQSRRSLAAKSKWGEGLGRCIELVEMVRPVTMFAAGVERLEGLKVGKLVEV